MSDKNSEKNIDPEIFNTFSMLNSSLEQNQVPFSSIEEPQSAELSVHLDGLKLYYPPTADLLLFDYSGDLKYRLGVNDSIIEKEDFYIKNYFGADYNSLQIDLTKYIFIRAYISYEANLFKLDEFEEYIEEWSKQTGFKVNFNTFCTLYTYIDEEELFPEPPTEDSVYYKLFINKLLIVNRFFDNALKQKYLVPPRASIHYFNDYGLYEFFNDVSKGTFSYYTDVENKRLFIRVLYKENEMSCFTKFFVTTEEISLALCPHIPRDAWYDMNVPIDARFKLKEDFKTKIRQFMSDYFQKSAEQSNTQTSDGQNLQEKN